MRWEGPPTDNREQSGKVKDTGGSFFGEEKGLKGGKLENCRRIPVYPVSAIRGGEGDVVVDKLGRDRGWKGLGWANREEGAGVVGLNVLGLVWVRFVGLVLSCRIMSCLILSCWGRERDGDKKLSVWA